MYNPFLIVFLISHLWMILNQMLDSKKLSITLNTAFWLVKKPIFINMSIHKLCYLIYSTSHEFLFYSIFLSWLLPIYLQINVKYSVSIIAFFIFSVVFLVLLLEKWDGPKFIVFSLSHMHASEIYMTCTLRFILENCASIIGSQNS